MLVYLQIIATDEDRSKFVDLYETYRGLMFVTAKKMLYNNEDAEDAVHQAFVKVAENIESIEPASSPRTKALLVLITEHRCIDMLRHREHMLAAEAKKLPGIKIEYSGDNILAYCINKLPANYREILLLRHHHGFSAEEAAKILGISKANAVKLLQRAKAKLELLCREEGLF